MDGPDPQDIKPICSRCGAITSDVSPRGWYLPMEPYPGYSCDRCFYEQAISDSPLNRRLFGLGIYALPAARGH